MQHNLGHIMYIAHLKTAHESEEGLEFLLQIQCSMNMYTGHIAYLQNST